MRKNLKKREIKKNEEDTEEIRSLNDLKNYFDDHGETFSIRQRRIIYKRR
jgi:hypothetical protein